MRGALSGNGHRPSSRATRAFGRSRTRSTPRCSSGTSTGCSAAARGSRTRSWPGPPFATGTYRSDGRSSPAFGAQPMPRATTAMRPELFEATRRSLQREPKELPSVWLYDERGSQLYEAITRLPDYYLPRREAEILAVCAGSIATQTEARTLIELGSGSARNTRFLLDA